jgi:hypothetical protein
MGIFEATLQPSRYQNWRSETVRIRRCPSNFPMSSAPKIIHTPFYFLLQNLCKVETLEEMKMPASRQRRLVEVHLSQEIA